MTGSSGSGRQGGQRGAYSTGSGGSFSGGAPRRPRNAGQAGTPSQGGDRRRREGARNDRPAAQSQPAHRIIKPSVKPVQMEVDYHKPVQQPVRRPQEEPVVNVPVEETAAAPEIRVESPAPAPVQAAETAAAPAPAPAETPAERPAQVPAAETQAPVQKPQEAPAREAEPAPVEVPVQKAAETPAEPAPAPAARETVTPAAAEEGRRERTERSDRPARTERTDRGDRPERTDRGPRPARTGRDGQRPGYGTGRTDRGDRPERTDRGDRGPAGSRYASGGAGRDGRDNRDGARQGGFAPRGDGRGPARPGQGRPQGGRPGFGGQQGRGAGFGEGGKSRRPAAGPGNFATEKKREDNKRKGGPKRDERSRKDRIYTEDETTRKNRPGRFIKPEKRPEEKVEEQIKLITIPEKITIRDLAEKMHIMPAEIIKKLFLQGQVMTPNSELDYAEAEKIAEEYEIFCEQEEKVDVIEELLKEEDDSEETMVPRPPVICVMGHVDHGKTSLLDAIRKTNVTDKEAGGITQAIGAYTVKIDGRSITFLDTPGHEAFTAMRMRGANSTDIAVLVVAADDGVMPQTVEAISHARAAGVEIVVAINKIDKPGANVDRVKQELTEHELVPTDWGGSTEFVEVSAKTGQGIEDLLETILLTADVMELKANPDRLARGLVLEAKLDKGRGPVANVLVQKGTLHVGDFISAGACSGKVRAMIDDKGRRVKEASPSQPVEILGLSDVPNAGEVIVAHENNETSKAFAATYKAQHKEELLEETRMRMNLDDLFSQMQEGTLKEFDLIVKADVQGSVEALKASLLKLSNEEVIVKVIHSGVGAITESDVSLASASNAVIIGFGVRPDATAKALADHEGVDIRLYKVIYQAIDAVEAALKGMLAPVYEERVIGHVEVRQLFKASHVGNIAGSYVKDGVIRRGCLCRITRDGEQIYEGKLASLKRFKDDAREVREGFECGLVFDGFDKMQVGDIVEAYDLVEVPRA